MVVSSCIPLDLFEGSYQQGTADIYVQHHTPSTPLKSYAGVRLDWFDHPWSKGHQGRENLEPLYHQAFSSGTLGSTYFGEISNSWSPLSLDGL